jgi:GLPGLI family protein
MNYRFSYLLSLFLMTGLFGHSQNNPTILVEYQKKNPTYESTEHLYAEKTEAWYVIEPAILKGGKIGKTDENDDTHGIINVVPNAVKPAKYFNRINEAVIFYEDYIGEKAYVVSDSVPKMNWQLIPNQSKKIGGYNCNKAVLQFRGTTIEAYYAIDIPISFGPWKFKGLPGLILEIYEKDVPYNSWIATKITFPYTSQVGFTIDKKGKELVKLKDFVALQDGDSKKMMDIIKSRMPKDHQMSNLQIKRVSIEKVYEWEK